MGKYKSSRVFSNKLKYYSGNTLYASSIIILMMSQYLYMGHYASFADLVIDGGPYLPEYKIEYNQYTKDLLFGIQFQCLIFAIGIVAG
jgi:hypothetical protein